MSAAPSEAFSAGGNIITPDILYDMVKAVYVRVLIKEVNITCQLR